MTALLEKLYSLLNEDLYLSCPVLSGNMRNHIDLNTVQPGDKEITIVISAPFYDMKEFKKSGQVKYTNKVVDGRTDYAQWVNDLGPFGRPGRSQHWVNRTCYDVASAIANEVGGVVINELDLR